MNPNIAARFEAGRPVTETVSKRAWSLRAAALTGRALVRRAAAQCEKAWVEFCVEFEPRTALVPIPVKAKRNAR